MSSYKATTFYSYKKSGASVSFYSTDSAYASHVDALLNFKNRIVPLFAALLGKLVQIDGLRVSDITIRGDSRVDPLGGFVGPGFTYSNVAGNSTPNDGNSCLVLNWNNAATHKGRTFLRFYPDTLAENGEYDPGPNYPTAIEDLRRNLRLNNWGFLAKASTASFRITLVNTNGASPNQLKITAPGHVVLTGQPFRLSGMLPKIGSPNGVWTAASISGSEITAEASGAFSAYNWGGKGTVIPLGKAVYVPEHVYVLTRIRSRKSGRPFDYAVGRRKTPQ
jgi:hypothetical protein